MAVITINDFVQEVNRWLDFQWKKADRLSDLPTQDRTWEYMEKQLDLWADANQDAFIGAINRKRVADDLPETFADIQVQTQMGFLPTAIEKNGIPEIRLVSGRATDRERTLLIFHCEKKELEVDGETATVIKSIALAGMELSDGISMMDLALQAQKLEVSVCGDKDINERWLGAAYRLKTRHPICPKCQHQIRLMGGDGPRQLVCDRCGWESQREYTALSEIADADNFQKEVKAMLQKAAYLYLMEATLDELDAVLQRTQAIYAARPKSGLDTTELDRQFKQSMYDKLLLAANQILES